MNIMKKAVFLDIDGTLIDSSKGIMEITPKVRNAIKKIQEDGNYVFIASGRPYAFISQDLLNFGFDGFILTNGANVIVGGKTIYKEPISKEFIKHAVEQFEEHNIQYILEGELYSYIKDSFKEFHAFYDKIQIKKTYFCGDFDLDKIDVYKMEMMYTTDSARDFCLDFINKNQEYDYCHSIAEDLLEMYARKTSKAVGIQKALEYLNIPIENSYAFGDGKNDIEMLQAVGCGIAMGNASEEVKKYADKVTESVENNGVAAGIEKYIF